MKKLNEFADSVAVVVSSCDAFFDCWQPFAAFFRKFWPGCPFPVHLIVNQLPIRSSYIRAMAVGEDRNWASNMKTALTQINAKRVLYLQEDYFLTAPVDEERLARDFAYAFENDVDAFCFRARSELESSFTPVNDDFGVVPPGSDGRTRCQLTLWRRDAFVSVLRDGETAWEMESRGSERTREMKILSYSTRDRAPVPYLMSAIVRGLWTPEAIELCKRHGVQINPRFRATYSRRPLLQRAGRVWTRVGLRRALQAHANAPIELE
ncbi:MAG: hypothetical protein ABR526_01280 [Chthoniobacterales bacterium]